MATDGFTQKTRVWGASGVFESGNSIDYFRLLVVAPKNKCKVRKMVKKCKKRH